MQARDLTVGPPRRWSETLGGIAWLPRLIDKARSGLNGTLGDYLYGQSPMDKGLLDQLGLSHRAFAVIVKNSPDDDAVLAALKARDPEAVERARRWSEIEIPHRHRLFLALIDHDDGYRGSKTLKSIGNAASRLISVLAKRALPSDAIRRAREE